MEIICFTIHDCVFNSFYDLEEDNEELPPPENLREVSGMKRDRKKPIVGLKKNNKERTCSND